MRHAYDLIGPRVNQKVPLNAVRDRPINIKTVRNVIDWHFRALFRDAREELEEQGIVLGDPFTRLRWQKTIREKSDPFMPEERDTNLEYFRTKKPAWFPLVYARSKMLRVW